MRHPFAGLIRANELELDRRSMLGCMAVAAAGLAVGNATAQITTMAVGEEGGVTKARGEEGLKSNLTTEPFGEEAGKVTSMPAAGLEDGKKNEATEKAGEAGGPTTERVGEEGGPMTKALREQGRVTTIPVEPMTEERAEKIMDDLWKGLASKDAAQGTQACAQIYGSKKAVEFLKGKLTAKPKEVNEKQIAQMIKDLDADNFETREKAENNLVELGLSARTTLEKALDETSSIETRMRLTRILEKSEGTSKQLSRGIEVLVALKTPEATKVLESLAEGPEKAWLTQAAKQALARVKK